MQPREVPGAPEILSTTEVYRNNWMVVTESHIRRTGAGDGIYGVVHKPRAVVVVAYRPPSEAEPSGSILLVEQYRFALKRRSWEFVAGTAPGLTTQAPTELARRELKEETGYRADCLKHVGAIEVAPGFCDQVQDVFVATDLVAGETEREVTEEDLIARWWPVDSFRAAVGEGKICDAQTLAAWALVERHLGL